MSESTLKSYWRDDGILVFKATDTSAATVEDWYNQSQALLEKTDAYSKRLYDLRELNTLSIMALRTAIRLKSHRNAHFVYAIVLTRSSRTASLVQTVLAIQPGGNFQVMLDEADAVHWLNAKVPPGTGFHHPHPDS
ncbi:MAG: hypothetical protein KA314_12235 [Chloroflexi bacterium]|nr:hypothetical protein [Chloroflexota bacterium]MBP8056604.1 hypothetical protein [Chloroflexota bacterium]